MEKFQTTILTTGKTATGIVIPDDVIANLNAGKKPPIKVTLNGYTYRSTVAVMGGRFMVGVNSDVRKASGVKGGDTLTVEIELDTEAREVLLPVDFKKALDKNPEAKKVFETLSHSKKTALVYPIDKAKKDETRERNIEKALGILAGTEK
jgi:hypothetical protein